MLKKIKERDLILNRIFFSKMNWYITFEACLVFKIVVIDCVFLLLFKKYND